MTDKLTINHAFVHGRKELTELECAVYGFLYRYFVLVRFIVFSVVVILYFSGVTTGGQRGGQLSPGAASEGAQNMGRKNGFYAIC